MTAPPHRRIYYCHGFDRRDARFFNLWQQREARAHHQDIIVTPSHNDHWTLRGETCAEFTFLDWSDMAARRLQDPVLFGIGDGFRLTLAALRQGIFGKIRRLDWAMGLLLLWGFLPFLLLLIAPVMLVLNTAIAAIIAIIAVLLLSLSKRTGAHYIQQIAYAARTMARDDPSMQDRIAAFAARINCDASETIIVGHSIGAALSLRLVHRLRETGHTGEVTLITIGQSIPLVSVQKEASALRRAISDTQNDPNLRWLDISAGRDWLGFDGVALGAARCLPARLSQAHEKPALDALRWRGFEMHFQYFRAATKPGAAWDWFAILTGKTPISERFAKTKVKSGRGERRFPI